MFPIILSSVFPSLPPPVGCVVAVVLSTVGRPHKRHTIGRSDQFHVGFSVQVCYTSKQIGGNYLKTYETTLFLVSLSILEQE